MNYRIEKTTQFDKWFKKLKNIQAKARIGMRFKMLTTGHFGDHKQLSSDLFELRFFYDAGYRVYYTVKNNTVILLLYGGDKTSQSKDIAQAKEILKRLEN